MEQAAITELRSPHTIRKRCGEIFELAQGDRLQHFRCDLTHLDRVADYVIQEMYRTYPNLNIPFHSRWRHFEIGPEGGPGTGKAPRLAQLDQNLAGCSPLEKARVKFDLAITSVLLDAGAGPEWRYVELASESGGQSDQTFCRSEGLAIASFHLFCQGAFSSDSHQPLQADAQGLQNLAEASLAQGFQVGPTNPLVGLTGRHNLLQRLSHALTTHPHFFGTQNPRPGNLVDYCLAQAQDKNLSASTILNAVLEGLGGIWPGRVNIAQINLGDVWPHPQLSDQGIGRQLIPFHKLSQWLTYSLLEPLQELGMTITELDVLTGLPEYRNGGLCLDLGLLQMKDPAVQTKKYPPNATLIVEWRALTIVLLDQIASAIRCQLKMTTTQLPLAKILQGGTWSAGRRIAAERRPGGTPPIQIDSDGTVF